MGRMSVLECIKKYMYVDDDGVRRLPRDFSIQGNTCSVEVYYGEYTGSREEWESRLYSGKKKKADREQTEDIIDLAAEGFLDDAAGLWFEYEIMGEASVEFSARDFERIMTRAEVIYGRENLAAFAKKLVMESDELGDVCLGIWILEREGYTDEECREALAILGSYYELAWRICYYFKKHCADADTLVMKIAKAQTSERRFFIMYDYGNDYELEPSTEEIRRWLLFDALEVDEPDYYKVSIAEWIFYKKLDGPGLLERELTQEEFEAVGRIFRVLYQKDAEDEQYGIYDPTASAEKFLGQCRVHAPEISAYEALYEICKYYWDEVARYFDMCMLYDLGECMLDVLEEHNRWEAFLAGCKDLFESRDFLTTLKEALKHGRGRDLAINLGLYDDGYYTEGIISDFEKNARLSDKVTEKENAEKVLDVFRKNYPPEIIRQGRTAFYGYGDEFEAEHRAAPVWAFLRMHPFMGMDYVEKGLNAKAWYTRRLAIETVDDWRWRAGRELSDCPRELVGLINEAYENEPCSDLKDQLGGLVEFEKFSCWGSSDDKAGDKFKFEKALNEYLESGAAVKIKSGFELEEEEFKAMGRLIQDIISRCRRGSLYAWYQAGGPDFLMDYVKMSGDYLPDLDVYETLMEIERFVRNVTKWDRKLWACCHAYFDSEECRKCAAKAAKSGNIKLAGHIGLRTGELLLEGMRENFEENFENCLSYGSGRSFGGPVPDCGEILTLFQENFPVESIPEGPPECEDVKENEDSDRRMMALLHVLYCGKFYPDAVPYVAKGITAPSASIRSEGLYVIDEWMRKAQKPLKSLSEELCRLLNDAAPKEPVDDLKERMEKILSLYTDTDTDTDTDFTDYYTD